MYSETISAETKRVLDKINDAGIAKQFYLAGGTALAIQMGHRMSIDLDFFSSADFSVSDLKKNLSAIGELTVNDEDMDTLNASLDGIKISFLRYGYEQIFPLVQFEKINLANERDIAAMKIDAASSRGTKKDFIDLYFLLQKYSLNELIAFFEQKYAAIQYNKMHILKSLVFFDDAENDPMPIMLAKVDWEEVKNKILKEALNF